MSPTCSDPTRRETVLVTGANGFLGHAVARAFVTAGYRAYGLLRKQDEVDCLHADEIVPILGTPDDLSFLNSLWTQSEVFDCIVSTTEDLFDYSLHFEIVLTLLIRVAQRSLSKGVRSLVLFTSGCKDYGIGPLSSPAVKPFTETSALTPPPILIPRSTLSMTVMDGTEEIFDACVLRPTTLYGGSSSYYGPIFEIGARAAQAGRKELRIGADPRNIMHGTHVDDAAQAYVKLSQAPRKQVNGECYNISSHRYETAREVADAIALEYGLDRVEYFNTGPPSAGEDGFDVVGLLFGFSQWVSSEKIRREVGWEDSRPLFSEALGVYRRSYEVAASRHHSNVERVKSYVDSWNRSNETPSMSIV